MGDTRVVVRIPVLENFAVQFGGVMARNSRRLTAAEKMIGESVYQQSINYDLIRIVITDTISGPITLGNNIRVLSNSALDRGTLVHELMHIWQFQNRGSGYISDSAVHQSVKAISTGDRNGAYAYTIIRGRSLDYYSAEQQAMIAEDFYMNATLKNHPDYLKLITEIRRARPSLTNMDRYQESLYGPAYQNPYQVEIFPELNQKRGATVPILRVEF